MSWIKYLFFFDRRPRIPTHLVTPFDISNVTPDELLIFKAGKARDRQYILRLQHKYDARNAVELLQRLPKRKRTPLRQRVRSLIARWEGALPYDPIRRELHEMRRDARRTAANGIRRNRMKEWR